MNIIPLDADGVPIHLGDVMEGMDKHDTLRYVKGEVIEVSYIATDSEGLVASVALQVWAADGKSWHRSYLDPYAAVYRHVKPKPTVEELLQEFGDWYAYTKGGCDEDGIVAEYAEKIREACE